MSRSPRGPSLPIPPSSPRRARLLPSPRRFSLLLLAAVSDATVDENSLALTHWGLLSKSFNDLGVKTKELVGVRTDLLNLSRDVGRQEREWETGRRVLGEENAGLEKEIRLWEARVRSVEKWEVGGGSGYGVDYEVWLWEAVGGAGADRGEVGGRGWSLGAVEKWGMGGAGADRMVRAPGTDGARTDGGWVLVWAIVNFRVPYFFLMMGIRVCRFSGLRMGCGRVCSCGATCPDC